MCNLMACSRCFQQVYKKKKKRKNPQYFLDLLGLRAGCTDYTLSFKKKKGKRRKPHMVPSVGSYLLSSQTKLLLRSCENIFCKVPKTTEIIVVMALPCRLLQQPFFALTVSTSSFQEPTLNLNPEGPWLGMLSPRLPKTSLAF